MREGFCVLMKSFLNNIPYVRDVVRKRQNQDAKCYFCRKERKVKITSSSNLQKKRAQLNSLIVNLGKSYDFFFFDRFFFFFFFFFFPILLSNCMVGNSKISSGLKMVFNSIKKASSCFVKTSCLV